MKTEQCYQCNDYFRVFMKGMQDPWSRFNNINPLMKNGVCINDYVKSEPNEYNREIYGDYTCFWLCCYCNGNNASNV